MRSEGYLKCAEWLNNLMIIMLYFISAELVYNVFVIHAGPLHILYIIAIVCFSYFARVYIRRLLFYIGAHLILWTFVLLMPFSAVYKVLGIVVIAVFTVFNFIFWAGEGTRSFCMINPWAVCIILLAFAYASWYERTILIKESYYCGIIFMAIFFIRTYLMNAVRFSNDMQVNSGTPLGEMFRNNGIMVISLVVLFALLMFLFQSDIPAAVFRWILKTVALGVRTFAKFIISFFRHGNTTVPVAEENPQAIDLDIEPSGSYPPWLITLVQVVDKLLVFLILAGAAFLLIRAIISFMKIYFTRFGYDIMTSEGEDYTDVNERIRHGEKRKTRKFLWPRDEREKIRRKYKKEVEGLNKRGYSVKRYHTPKERLSEIESKGYKTDNREFRDLTEKYEYYRYGKM